MCAGTCWASGSLRISAHSCTGTAHDRPGLVGRRLGTRARGKGPEPQKDWKGQALHMVGPGRSYGSLRAK